MKIKCKINNKDYELEVNGNERLLDLLRDRLGLKGTKCGCEIGECGACTVLLNNKAVNSCLILAAQINNSEIETIEFSNEDVLLKTISESFLVNGGIQCGFCSPGMIMSTKALLLENAHPSIQEIKTALEGNLCRCTGYQPIIDSIMRIKD